jgi:hypothetical protein
LVSVVICCRQQDEDDERAALSPPLALLRMLTMSLSIALRVTFCVLALAVVSCGHSSATAVGPLVGGAPVPVTLTTSVGTAAHQPPEVSVAGLPGAVEARFQLDDDSCLIAHAGAERAGTVLAIKFTRLGDPLGDCVARTASYTFVARVATLDAGPYEVHVIDERYPDPAREIGMAMVTVRSVP